MIHNRQPTKFICREPANSQAGYTLQATRYKRSRGQILVETLLAIFIAALVVPLVAQMLFTGLEGSRIVGQRDGASELGREVFEAVKSTAFERWLDVYRPPDGTGDPVTSKGVSNHYYPSLQNGKWTILSGDETVVVGDISYTRYFTIDNVSRDPATRDIESSYTLANDDPSTQKITVTVSRGNNESLSWSEYLLRWRNKICYQTDWSGTGSGTTICPTTLYESETDTDFSVSGSLKITPL
ncbi:MAG: hypothetical protein BMS9Abin13_109 [Patescibacteria group bacterium]|nr:MAG: hypothetical protein BMS9Abin13_109 [Patescibacteria group bacterium]